MRLGVLNGELGIFAIDSLEDLGALQEKQLRRQMPEGVGLNDLAFFYMKDRDWVVLNRSHALYEYYADIISCYLELTETGRREAAEKAPVEEVREALRILDDVIWRRTVIYGRKENQEMRVDSIKIYPCFAEHQPKVEKMEQKERYFMETRRLQSQIILDSRGNLIDGYTSYLLARAHGIQSVPVRYGRRQVIKASHRPGGKLYTWELPGALIDRVSAGDKAVVRTERGVRAVTVETVEEYAGNGPEPLKTVIKVKRRAQREHGN